MTKKKFNFYPGLPPRLRPFTDADIVCGVDEAGRGPLAGPVFAAAVILDPRRPIDGLRESGPWTNREVTTTHHVPESLVILGGGVVGVEMAQAYASFGTRVTLVEALDRLIAKEEEFASEQVADALRGHGVTIHFGRKATKVERAAGATTVTP